MAREKLETKLANIYRHEGLAPEEFPPEYWTILDLIRKRDAYQRARVRRIVKRQRKIYVETKSATMQWNAFKSGNIQACDDLLTALKGKSHGA